MRGHKFILFSHHRFNTWLVYVNAVPFLWVKFLTMFFLMNSCISSVKTIFNKRWNDSVLQESPISLDNTVGPPKQRQCTPPVQFKWVKYHSQSHTSIVPALKNELLNSLPTFSSGKVSLCRQTQIRFGVPVQCLCSKDDNVSAAL